MTVLKDLLDIPKYPKVVLIAILLVGPFWYLDVRVFDVNQKFTGSIELPAVFTFCLTVVQLFLNYFLVLLIQQTFWKNSGSKMQDEPIYMFFWTLLWSIPVLAFNSYLFHYMKWKFFYLVTGIYSFSFVLLLPLLIYCLFRGDFFPRSSQK